MTDDLDTLLAAPLAEPADMGFSARVMTGVADLRMRRAKQEALLSLAAVVLLTLIAALTPAGAAIAHAAEIVAGTPAVLFAALTVMLSGVVYTRVRA